MPTAMRGKPKSKRTPEVRLREAIAEEIGLDTSEVSAAAVRKIVADVTTARADGPSTAVLARRAINEHARRKGAPPVLGFNTGEIERILDELRKKSGSGRAGPGNKARSDRRERGQRKP
jgi:hypothetical protein